MSLLQYGKNIARRVVPAPVWTQLRLLRLRRGVAQYKRRVVTHRYGRHDLTVRLADPLGEGWYDRDWPPLPEIELALTSRLRPGSVVFDLGAHQGVVAMMLAHEVGANGRVVAVEANAHNVSLARANCETNRLPQVVVEHAAVADVPGTVRFNEGLNGSVDDGGGWGSHEVTALTVDGLAERYGAPDVLMIDVEGFECHVLRGATATLARRPDCCVEVHGGCGLEGFGGSIETVFEQLGPGNYTYFAHTPDDPRPRRVSSPADVPRTRFFLTALASGSGPSA
jgi:FkbM family methyltransferase